MDLREALTQIHEIRAQMARTEVFRGYRALPVAFSGVLAFAAMAMQAAWIGDPERQWADYLRLWIGAAVLSAIAAGAGMAVGGRRQPSAWRRRITWLAIEQFLPCLVAGGAVTAAISAGAPEARWMLPGLWQVLFGLGVFASCRLLPRATFAVGVFYLIAGAVVLAAGRPEVGPSPWAMGLPFGVGQLLAGAVLYWTLERGDGDN